MIRESKEYEASDFFRIETTKYNIDHALTRFCDLVTFDIGLFYNVISSLPVHVLFQLPVLPF
jgi:hypothetical protein